MWNCVIAIVSIGAGRRPRRATKVDADGRVASRITMVIALHHVNATVSPELEQATKDFYGSVLGLRELPKPKGTRPSGAWYQIGANELHLSVERDDNGPLSSRHICFTVDDLKATEQRFRDAGIAIIPDPRPREETPRFYVRDPGGNMLEIAAGQLS